MTRIFENDELLVEVFESPEETTVMVLPREGHRIAGRYTQPLGSPSNDFTGGQSVWVPKGKVDA